MVNFLSLGVFIMNAISVFEFQPSCEVRVIVINDEPWFVAADVAAALDYSAAPQMTRNLDDDEKGMQNVHTLGGQQEMLVINESGLYSAILKSRKPESKKFKKWITSEVLPAIRKTGSYSVTDNKPQPPALLGEIAVWVMAQYVKNLERYISKSGQQISSRLHTYIRARFGVVNVRDIPSLRLDELLNELEQFYQQAYAMWQVCQKLERAWLQTIYKPQYESRFEIPAVIQQEITNNVNDNHGIETMPQVIRKEALQRLLG